MNTDSEPVKKGRREMEKKMRDKAVECEQGKSEGTLIIVVTV